MTWQQTLTEAAAALTETTEHIEQRWRWDKHRNRKPAGQHRTILPGLLEQLYRSVDASPAESHGGAGGTPRSRPPLALEALSDHAEISTAVMLWCGQLGMDWMAGGVLPNLRALAAVGTDLPDTPGQSLTKDVVRWRNICLVMTGWERIYRPRGISCPETVCGKEGTLRVNLTAQTAMCRACKQTWSGWGDVVALAQRGDVDLRCPHTEQVSSTAG